MAARRPRRIKLSSAIPTTYGVAAAPITRTPTGQSPTTLTPKRPGDARIELGVKAFDARHYDSARWRVPAGCQRPGQPGWRHRQSRTRRRQGHRAGSRNPHVVGFIVEGERITGTVGDGPTVGHSPETTKPPPAQILMSSSTGSASRRCELAACATAAS